MSSQLRCSSQCHSNGHQALYRRRATFAKQCLLSHTYITHWKMYLRCDHSLLLPTSVQLVICPLNKELLPYETKGVILGDFSSLS